MQVVLVQADDVEPGELGLDPSEARRVVGDHKRAGDLGAALKRLDEIADGGEIEEHGIGVGDGIARLLMLDDAPASAGAQPQQGRYLLKRHAELDGVRVLVGEVEEDRVLLEPIGHGELVGELVVALDGITLGRLARDGRRDAWLGNVLADAQGLPIGIALTRTMFDELFCLVLGDLVVRDADGAPAPAVLVVQAHDGMRRGARPRKEVDHERIGLAGDKETNSVLDGIEGLWEREAAVWNYFSQHTGAISGCIVRCDAPLRTGNVIRFIVAVVNNNRTVSTAANYWK